jgi:hypothetical protein
MKVCYRLVMRTLLVALVFCVWLRLGLNARAGQTYDFGFIPLGTTNKVGGFQTPLQHRSSFKCSCSGLGKRSNCAQGNEVGSDS